MDGGVRLITSFEELRIWKRARQFVAEIYGDFGPTTRGSRDSGFRDQIQRAGLSIMNNIAEGFERASPSEFLRFLDFAKASCGEVRSMYYAAEDLSYIESNLARSRRATARGMSAGIESLRQHLRQRKTKS